MCGIAGILRPQGEPVLDADLQAMACAMPHRGPDASGTWSAPGVGFAHTRLSLFDLSDAANQPWVGGGDALVFNGEIYNYLELRTQLHAEFGAEFATDGDGEAIVAAYHHWGTAALSRLRGMFAFALWDTVRRELFCARDPFGIKPLFMATGPAGTAVGSEEKCLLDVAGSLGADTAIDHRALQHYTVLQYVPEPETLHTGIRRLESGCYAVIRPGRPPASTDGGSS